MENEAKMTKVQTIERSGKAESGPLTEAKKGVVLNKEIKKERTGRPREATEKKKNADDGRATEKVFITLIFFSSKMICSIISGFF